MNVIPDDILSLQKITLEKIFSIQKLQQKCTEQWNRSGWMKTRAFTAERGHVFGESWKFYFLFSMAGHFKTIKLFEPNAPLNIVDK